jgi:hypothetical protein
MANPLAGMKLLDYIMAGLGIKDLFSGGGGMQDRATFEGEYRDGTSLDPRDTLAEGMNTGRAVQTDLRNKANRPVALRSAYVQQPPTFTGGGMPMPIGVSGYDPALSNPGLQYGEGLDLAGPDAEAQAAIDLIKGSQWKPGVG